MITVNRKVVEVRGKLYIEAPKGRKYRSTIYPVRTPDGYPLAEKLVARAEQVRAEMEVGRNLLGLMFPSPRLEPATIDGLVYACSMVMLYAARHPQVTAPRLARWLLALGIAATLAANMAVGAAGIRP